MEIQNTIKPKMSAKDFFLYLGILITLYVSSIALISFLFTAIDIIFPKNYVGNTTETIAWSLSVFIVFYPIMIILLSSAIKMIRNNPAKAGLGVRNWFIYLTLFITALTIAIDLMVLLNYFLSGEELTVGFVLKVISIVLVAGLIFWFSLKDLKGAFIQNNKLFNIFRVSASVIVAGLIVIGLILIGSPSELRKQNDDIVRVEHLNFIQSEIINFWQSKSRLPENLSELNDPLLGFETPNDPKTETAYEYTILDANTFELCATFATDSDGSQKQNYNIYYGATDTFAHKAERTCFERTIDPDKFPLLKEVPTRLYER